MTYLKHEIKILLIKLNYRVTEKQIWSEQVKYSKKKLYIKHVKKI